MCISKCVFLYCMIGKYCRSVAVTVAGLDGQILPVWGGSAELSPCSPLALNGEIELVEVGLAKAALRYFEEPRVLQLLLVGAHAAFGGAHIVGQFLLSRKTEVVLARVLEQHGVVEFRTHAEIFVCENEVGDLREPMQRHEIGTNNFDIALNFSDVSSNWLH